MRTQSRRGFLRFLTGSAIAAAGTGLGLLGARSTHDDADTGVALPPLGADLPPAQHAWDDVLPRTPHGNVIPPSFHRLLLFSLAGAPSGEDAVAMERALRSLEATYEWAAEGLLFIAGWGSTYFESIGEGESPIARAEPLSDLESPALDTYDLCLHLASDVEERLAQVEAALVAATPLPTGGAAQLPSVLRHVETRTGFIGDGLPASRQDVAGIPPGRPVHENAPLFMGFASGLRKNQATEPAVTIAEGRFAGGTTMQVSQIRLELDSWYGDLDQEERGQRMFAPHLRPDKIAAITDEAASDPELGEFNARRYGVVGHAQLVSRARREGEPLILRRDFSTTDGGQAGLHFVSLQRSMADFREVRKAMTASEAPSWGGGVEERRGNGIKEFLTVERRGNYLVPPRSMRSFPGLIG